MSTTRRPEDVTEEELERTWKALRALPHIATASISVGMDKNDVRDAIASGLLVPPPRERTQMEKDEEEWRSRLNGEGDWTADDANALHMILRRLFPTAKAAGVTY